MNQKLIDALEDSLQRLEKGQALDFVLSCHPDLAAQLRPLLESARLARSLDTEKVSLTRMRRGRSRVLGWAADLRRQKPPVFAFNHFWRTVTIAISVLALLVMSGKGLLIASAHSLPGDTLYPLKRSVETTQMTIISNPVFRQALESEFSRRRLDETRSLITIRRVEPVEFNGVIADISDDRWTVSGIPVVVTTDTQLTGKIVVGDDVQVSGSTNPSGNVQAASIARVTGEQDDQEKNTPSATWTSTATETDLPARSTDTPVPSFVPRSTGTAGSDQWSDSSNDSGSAHTPAPTEQEDYPTQGSTTPHPTQGSTTPHPTEGGESGDH